MLSAVLVAPCLAMAGYTSSSAKPDGVTEVFSAWGLIMKITNWLLGFVAALAVLMIVVSGIMYITSAGDSGRVDKAKGLLVASVTGLVIAILGYAIVRVISVGLGAS